MTISRDPLPLPTPAAENTTAGPRGTLDNGEQDLWGKGAEARVPKELRATGIGDGCLGSSNDELPF